MSRQCCSGEGRVGDRELPLAKATFRMRLSAAEMSHWPAYDYVIVNRDIQASVARVAAIVTAERLRRTRQHGLADFVTACAPADRIDITRSSRETEPPPRDDLRSLAGRTADDEVAPIAVTREASVNGGIAPSCWLRERLRSPSCDCYVLL